MSALAWPLVVLVVSLLALWRFEKWAAARNHLGVRMKGVEANLADLSERFLSVEKELIGQQSQIETAGHDSALQRERLAKVENELKVTPPASKAHTAEALKRFR